MPSLRQALISYQDDHMSSLRQALISYQDDHMLLPTLADAPARRAASRCTGS